ncbi:Transmembrane protein 132A [Heterocephalus glaber]|uniref:Transmembrane protein 132A n=1 Tax=Heterocephalus glaber TaxID=10181 RepID=G5AYE5_HETGA|nr:Transmembrane protein 132A [Heterocephalus glaber]
MRSQHLCPEAWGLGGTLASAPPRNPPVHGDLDTAVYLPAALELLDAPEHFLVQRASHYARPCHSLGSRSETFLLLHPWPRAQPLLRASYPPFATQQVVPPRATEPPQRPVPWDVRAVSVEAAVTPAEPHARVVFHLRGQDWPPGPSSLPCARLYATHPAGTTQRACRFQPALGACAVELALPAPWFSGGAPSRAELAYALEPATEGPGGCAPGRDEDLGQRALPVGSVELRPEAPPQHREVPLDEAVTLRVPDAPTAFPRVKVKKGLQVTAARPVQPALWTAKLDRVRGSKHHSTLITCHRAEFAGPDPSSVPEPSEFLWVDFLVENSTGGGVVVTRAVTWQLEYPGQAPAAEKDKMVWEILVSERDIRALVPLAKAEELVNPALLTGQPGHVPVRLVTMDAGGVLAEVTEHIGCKSADTQVLQVSEACDALFVAGTESRGAKGPVMGIALALSRGTAHPGEVTATCWAQSAPPAPKQEVALSLWLSFSDRTMAPAELYACPPQSEAPSSGWCTAWLGLPPTPMPAPALPPSPTWSPLATEASVGGRRRAAGSVDVRGKFEQAGEDSKARGEDKDEDEEEEEEEMVPAPQRVTDLELGMYALLGVFCLAILIFLVNGVVFVLRYQRKEPPDGAADPASPQPHNWVWLGTDQEELSRQLDRGAPELPGAEGSCPCGSGVAGEPQAPAPGLPGDTPGSSSTLARKEVGGRRRRVEFVTFAPVPPAPLPEEPAGPPTVQSILVAGEEDIRWVCEDMGLKDPEELRNYMERIRGSS